MDDDRHLIDEAKAVLRGKAGDPEQMFLLAQDLKQQRQFGLARRLLSRARKARPLDIRYRQQLAHCTYSDPDLPVEERLDLALELLTEGEDLATTTDQETLGLAGAIFKRKWEHTSRQRYLERSLGYYHRGYEQGIDRDRGYTAINAAFILDLLASAELEAIEQSGFRSRSAEQRLEQAQHIRREIVEVLERLTREEPDDQWSGDWWLLVTLAEALFGLRRYEDARSWLARAKPLKGIDSWEFESTVRQLASMTRLHEAHAGPAELVVSEPGTVLEEFLGGQAPGVMSALLGKFGVALSGGGFRASLFHIGVLAKLAEVDLLRHVEVLSCVSGGSILGAHYYLKVRHLLQTVRDEDITRDHYVSLVMEMVEEFLDGVQENLRTRVAAEYLTNLKMIFLRHYSRTDRIGELFEEHIFAKVKDGEHDAPRYLNQLFVHPLGEPEDFSPKKDNWRRRAKVPVLILNATTLNTGHNWQFTASWMGESPAAIDPQIDGNPRLRRMYYREAPEPYRRFRLGRAVAASASVPGLFAPILLPDLYPGQVLALVDGGVHDNQGNVGLLEQDCTVMLVSDAAGQLQFQTQPGRGILAVPFRAQTVLMARVREAQHAGLGVRRDSGLLRGLGYVHTKQGLSVDPVDWVDCQDPHEASDEARPAELRGPLTQHGTRKDVQERVSAIRTDLDSFSEAEAYALMTTGYLMAEHELTTRLSDLPTAYAERKSWVFLQVEDAMTGVSDAEPLKRLLEVGRYQAFKIWRLSRPLAVAATILGVAVTLLIGWLLWLLRERPILTFGDLGLALLILGVSMVVGKTILRIVRLRDTIAKVAVGAGMALGGFLAARLHLHVFDKWYLRRGRVGELTE